MPAKDARVDAYIAKSADFAKPVLIHIRKLVHTACPEVEETIKWGFPHFTHKGMLCFMAAFKQHCAFGFWKRALMPGLNRTASDRANQGLGRFGRLTRIADLPNDAVLLRHLREAIKLNEAGITRPAKAKPKDRKEMVIPDCLTAALKKNAKARTAFENLSYSHKKEYVEWITEAKREETRAKRLATTVQWLAQGKSRNWKYQNC